MLAANNGSERILEPVRCGAVKEPDVTQVHAENRDLGGPEVTSRAK
jgi:hypothetical protein